MRDMGFLEESSIRCSFKATNLAITLLIIAAANISTCAAFPVVQGAIRVFNVIADPVTTSDCRDFVGRNIPAGTITIPPMGGIAWRFRGYKTNNHDWTCRFHWTDSSTCGGAYPGAKCAVHSKTVRLWYSICRDCVWRTHIEGFYRRDGRVQPANWQFMFPWD